MSAYDEHGRGFCRHLVNGKQVPCPPMCPIQSHPRSTWRRPVDHETSRVLFWATLLPSVAVGALGLLGGIVEPLIGGLIATTVLPGSVYVLETLMDEGAHS